MEHDKQLSDLKLERKECSKCGAVWLNGNHLWTGTGRAGDELDLAGLVCNKEFFPECINPKKGEHGGDTWEKRIEYLKKIEEEEGIEWGGP